jgi:Arc/MetJ-type ribon-helix-helix transcriptional regulator
VNNNILVQMSALIALVSAAAAWSAVFVQRRNATDTIRAQVNIGARNSRASVVSANRQKWIDCLRDDVAELMATRSQLAQLTNAGSLERSGQDALLSEQRELTTRLLLLRVRIELRINRNEAEHLGLLEAIDRFDREFTNATDTDLRIQASAIFKTEWERLKREAAGTNPFVKDRDFKGSATQTPDRFLDKSITE